MGHSLGAGAFASYPLLRRFGKDFVGEFAEPGLQHGADNIDVVQVVLFEEINIEFCLVLAR